MFTAISAGGITITEIAILLFDQTSSGSFWVANSVWPFVAAPAVLHGMSTVALAPTARPPIARVPTTGPLYPSVSSTLKLVVTSSSPAFFTVTTMCAVSPRATRAGAVIAVTAISVGLGFTVTTALRWLLAELSSERLCVAIRVWSPNDACVRSQLNVRSLLAPTASPFTVCVPIVTPSVASCRVTSKLPATF